MWSILQELFISTIFFILICLITFSSPQQRKFYQVQHLQNYFLNTRQPDLDFTQVFIFDEFDILKHRNFFLNF